jgi:L-aminopeptidase/D-esterase-like protein
MSFEPGPRNLITDVEGLRVGNASDNHVKSGVTVLLCDEPAIASAQVLGGSPGTRETDLLEPHNMVETIHAITLSGGSAFGLDAASGVQAYLREHGMGLPLRGQVIPIVPAAILLDLFNGGDKNWGAYPPYRELGYEAASRAELNFEIGTAGAGTGGLTATVKGGLGSASARLANGSFVGALAATNPRGSPLVGKTRQFWAAPFEKGKEFGGLGFPSPLPDGADNIIPKYPEDPEASQNTTLAVVATDLTLTKSQAKTLAIAAHDGFARAIWPVHLPVDGDIVFALSTGTRKRKPDLNEFVALCSGAAAVMARAIARGIHAARPAENDLKPTWSLLPGK